MAKIEFMNKKETEKLIKEHIEKSEKQIYKTFEDIRDKIIDLEQIIKYFVDVNKIKLPNKNY